MNRITGLTLMRAVTLFGCLSVANAQQIAQKVIRQVNSRMAVRSTFGA